MDNTKKLWFGLALVLIVAFGVLGLFGREVYRKAPLVSGWG